MEFEKLELSKSYRLVNHGPTVLVSTTDGTTTNACAVAWCAPASRSPARFVLTIGKRHKTYENLTKIPECVINIPTLEAMDELLVCGHQTGHDGDKLAKAGVKLLDSETVKPHRLAACIAWIEAKMIGEPVIDGTTLIVVEATHVETVPGVLDPQGHMNVQTFKTLHHLGGPRFALPGEVFERHN